MIAAVVMCLGMMGFAEMQYEIICNDERQSSAYCINYYLNAYPECSEIKNRCEYYILYGWLENGMPYHEQVYDSRVTVANVRVSLYEPAANAIVTLDSNNSIRIRASAGASIHRLVVIIRRGNSGDGRIDSSRAVVAPNRSLDFRHTFTATVGGVYRIEVIGQDANGHRMQSTYITITVPRPRNRINRYNDRPPYVYNGRLGGGLNNVTFYMGGLSNDRFHRYQWAFQQAVDDWNWLITPGRRSGVDYRGVNLNFVRANNASSARIIAREEGTVVTNPDLLDATGWVVLRNNSGVNITQNIVPYQLRHLPFFEPYNLPSYTQWFRACVVVGLYRNRPIPEHLLGGQLRQRGISWRSARNPGSTNNAIRDEWYYTQEMRKIFSHELGHVLGLAHSSGDRDWEEHPNHLRNHAGDVGILMAPFWNLQTAYSPTLNDLMGIINHYWW